jgi:hypothetical protein
VDKKRNKVKGKNPTKVDILGKYELTETDKKVIQYKLQYPEITHLELSLLIDVSRTYVTECLNKPVVKKALAELEDNFGANWKARIIAAKEKASKKLIKLIDNTNPAVSIRACENILQLDKLELDDKGTEDNDLQFEGW